MNNHPTKSLRLHKSTRSKSGKSAFKTFGLAVSAVTGALLLSQSAQAAPTTGWANDASGDYNTSSNWVGGNINGIFDSSLTFTSARTIQFSQDTTLSNGLTFDYTGSASLTLRGNLGNFTVTLGGDIIVNPVSNQTVTIGSTSANQNLNVDLGGAVRNIYVGGTSNLQKVLVLVNSVSDGGLNLSGFGKVVLDNSSNTLSSITLNGPELVISGGSNASVNTVDTVTGALTIGGTGGGQVGTSIHDTITLTAASGRNTQFNAGSFVRNPGGVVLFRGNGLGTAAISSSSANTTNVSFASAPTLTGTGALGTTTAGIIFGAYGDTSATGTGFGTTGGLVTYDPTNGVRLLNVSEYKTSITDGQTQLDNILLTNSSGSISTVTLNSNTSVNSLSIATSAANSGITLGGSGTLKINSGVIYAATSSGATSTNAIVIGNTIDLNGHEGLIIDSTVGQSGGVGGADLQISGAITNDGGHGLTINGAATSVFEMTGTNANTYTGVTTLNSGILALHKSVSNVSIVGDLVQNGGTIQFQTSNQIADTSNVTINGGAFDLRPANNSGSGATETINNLTMNGGSVNDGGGGTSNTTFTVNNLTMTGGLITVNSDDKMVVNGVMTITPGVISNPAITINKSTSILGVSDTVMTLNGGLAISNSASGAFTAINLVSGTSATNFGGKIILNGDVTFTGNATNTNTVLISGTVGNGPAGVIALSGSSANRTFNIGDGAAAVDLTISAPLVDGSGPGGLIKTGAGTMALTGSNTYTGATTVSAGALEIDGSLSSGSAVTVDAATLSGTGTVNGTVALTGTSTLLSASNLVLAQGFTVDGAANTIASGSITGNATQNANSALAVNGTLSGSDSLGSGASLSGTGIVGAVALSGNNALSSAGTLTVASVDVSGAGNVISSGTVAATAGTTVRASSSLNVNGTLGGGAVSVSGTLGGSGKVTAPVTVHAGGSTNPGTGGAPAVLTLDLAYNSGALANFNISSTNPGNGSPRGHLSGLYYSQIVVTGSANVVNLLVGNGTLGADSATSQSETAAQIQGDGTSNSGVTLKLSLSSADYATLIGNQGGYVAGGANSALDHYFVFNLGSGLATGRFTTLDVNIDGTDYSGTIYYSGANDRFATSGVGNTLGDVILSNGQEFALSYVGDYASNSTIGGNDIVLTAIPEPGTWGMVLTGFGLLIGIQKLRRRRVGI